MDNLITIAALVFTAVNFFMYLVMAGFANKRWQKWLFGLGSPISVLVTGYIGTHVDEILAMLLSAMIFFLVCIFCGIAAENGESRS